MNRDSVRGIQCGGFSAQDSVRSQPLSCLAARKKKRAETGAFPTLHSRCRLPRQIGAKHAALNSAERNSGRGLKHIPRRCRAPVQAKQALHLTGGAGRTDRLGATRAQNDFVERHAAQCGVQLGPCMGRGDHGTTPGRAKSGNKTLVHGAVSLSKSGYRSGIAIRTNFTCKNDPNVNIDAHLSNPLPANATGIGFTASRRASVPVR